MSKYPKRGEDCEYTEDCMWGADGWCEHRMEFNKQHKAGGYA